MSDGERGFSLIEVLVVILIIGLLSAIALPSFLNQKTKAVDAKFKSAARTAQTAMETYYSDRGSYSGATPAALQGIESSLNDTSVTLTVPAATADSYTVRVANPSDPTDSFSIAHAASGSATRSCGSGASACAGGSW